MQLPYFQTLIKELSLLQSRWASILNPLIGNPSLQSNILSHVHLINGAVTINHQLGYPLTGWRIIRKRATADIWDSQDSNQSPQLTLILNSNAIVSVDLEVF